MDHASLARALSDPAFYPHPVEHVDVVQTHVSSVFLTGERVYKLKKRVDFGFLDFTTLEKRRAVCDAEVALNRRLAPEIYLGIEPITLTGGEPRLGGDGEVVDWVVVMRQLDQDGLGPRVLERGELGPEQIDQLIEMLVPFYRNARTGDGVDQFGTVEAVRFNTDENFAQTEGFVGSALTRERFDHIRRYTDAFYDDHHALFQRRVAEGRTRESHGDLHLGNIFFLDRPVIFDCIEFNDRFRCGDVAVDLAFLAMDLDFQGRDDLADRLVRGYADAAGDDSLLEVIDFYKVYRAYVRAKIACFTSADDNVPEAARAEQLDLARRYFGLAYRYADGEGRPPLLAFYGLMGTGSTTLARHLHDQLGWTLLSSDPIRKELAGLDTDQRVYIPWGEGLYSAEMSEKVYAEMIRRAEPRLAGGFPVILDGSFKSAEMRRPVLELADRVGAAPLLLRTECEPSEQRRRLEARQKKSSVSDGRIELIDSQRTSFEDPTADEADVTVAIATDGPHSATQRTLRDALVARAVLSDVETDA